jgi:hypothetical protein
MRGPIRIGLLAISLVSMFAFIAASAFADADDHMLDAKGSATVLRDVSTATPKNQPDALEFVNNGEVKLATTLGTIGCTELEFGTTMLHNTVGNVVFALPFGVAEGDNCKLALVNVPTYFDTLNNGVVGNQANGAVASVTVADTNNNNKVMAKVENLKFSQKVPGVGGSGFCVGDVNGKEGTVENSEGPFVEESTPNLNVQFTETVIPVTNGEGVVAPNCPTEGKLTGNFFLETPSTVTDTAWFNT